MTIPKELKRKVLSEENKGSILAFLAEGCSERQVASFLKVSKTVVHKNKITLCNHLICVGLKELPGLVIMTQQQCVTHLCRLVRELNPVNERLLWTRPPSEGESNRSFTDILQTQKREISATCAFSNAKQFQAMA